VNQVRSTSSDHQAVARNSRSLRVPTPGTACIFQQIPSPALQPFVDSFLVVEFPLHHDDAHLPDVRPVAACSFRGRCRINRELWAPSAGFAGPRATLQRHEHLDNHAVLLATFTAVGAAAFLPSPLEEFGESTVDLSGVLGRHEELEQLRDQITDAPSHTFRIELLERFLLSRLRVASPDPLVSAAVDWLQRDSQAKRISQLARYVGLSQSALERRFRKIAGISPKRFASIERLRRAVHLRSSGADLTLAAHSAGYFDQSHFIHDFRRATNSTPEAFFRQFPLGRTPNSYNSSTTDTSKVRLCR
jgi:AraC-like DNA-binding protein